MHSQNLLGCGRRHHVDVIQVVTLQVTSMLLASFASSRMHEDPPHGLGGGSKKMAP
jgi:hypothetical protein